MAKENSTVDKDQTPPPPDAPVADVQSLAPVPTKTLSFEEKYSAQIAQKIAAGLTRESAIQVINDQIANDAAKAKKK